MENKLKHPKPGVTVVILKDGKALLGRRKNSHGAGKFAFPGGKLEWEESFEGCARREAQEETGLSIKNIRFLRLLNSKFDNKHFVEVALLADWESGEPKNMEPEKCEGWKWYDLDNLPTPFLEGCASCIEAYKTGKNYFDM